jgi:hypothetical protein
MSLRFATALFLSAMLLFTCQPLVARMIVPLLGGAPAVWILCSLAFQALLLAGYGYAHFVGTRFPVRTQVVFQIVLVLSVFLVLPVAVDEAVAERMTRDNQTLGLLLLLLRTIGLPFFVLSTTSPLLQRWFAELGETDPYYLYAASNAGSMIALLGYPFIVEPTLAVGAQSRAMHVGYAAFTLLLLVCATTTFTRRHPKAIEVAVTPIPPPVGSEIDLGFPGGSLAPGERPTLLATPKTPYARMSQRLTWIALAFAPSSLLLGVTEYVTTDVASVPLLWVVPLAIYLATFIVAFGKRQPIAESTWARLLALTAALVVALMITQQSRPTWMIAGLHLLLLFLGAVVCHRALARLRPRVSRLTEFYLLLSVGGVLGGIFNGLIAPALFDDLFEYPLAIGLVCLGRFVLEPDPESTRAHIRRDVIYAGLASLLLLLASRLSQRFALPFVVLAAIPLVVLAIAFTWSAKHPVRYAVMLVGIAFAGTRSVGGEVIFEDRSFFGVLKVKNEPALNVRTLVYGRTVHGMESLDPAKAMVPLSYFHESGPAGDVLGPLPTANDEIAASRSIGVIGLGIGSLASYARAGDTWTFFEINPMVATIARKHFRYLPLAEARSTIEVEIGDARLRLKSGAAQRFDVLVLDAFNSDAIPVHLVTREALAIYRRALKPNGTLLAHVSNKHVDLKPVFGALAKDAGMLARVRRDEDVSKVQEEAGKAGSVWVILTESVDEMMRVSVDQPAWTPIVAPESQKVWTDDFANVLGAMR